MLQLAEGAIGLQKAGVRTALRQQQINGACQHHTDADAQAGDNDKQPRRPQIAALRHRVDMHSFGIISQLVRAFLFAVFENCLNNI
ncbi:MAG: hypothetical protein ACLU99_02310 [Alphaproteobacteria bacterium]